MPDPVADAYARVTEGLIGLFPSGAAKVSSPMPGWVEVADERGGFIAPVDVVASLDAELARIDRTQRREPAED